LLRQPLATSGSLVKSTKLTPATVNKSLVHLERLGIVTELTSRQRGRVFSYARYSDILNEDMELPGGQ
jgi:Fic family protein